MRSNLAVLSVRVTEEIYTDREEIARRVTIRQPRADARDETAMQSLLTESHPRMEVHLKKRLQADEQDRERDRAEVLS